MSDRFMFPYGAVRRLPLEAIAEQPRQGYELMRLAKLADDGLIASLRADEAEIERACLRGCRAYLVAAGDRLSWWPGYVTGSCTWHTSSGQQRVLQKRGERTAGAVIQDHPDKATGVDLTRHVNEGCSHGDHGPCHSGG